MDKILEKLDVYDLLARLFTGITVLTCAEFFGFIDILHPLSNDKTQLFYYLLIGGYFIGIVLEELLYVFSLFIKILPKFIISLLRFIISLPRLVKLLPEFFKRLLSNILKPEDKKTTAEPKKKGNSIISIAAFITLTSEEENKRLELISAGYEYLLEAPLYQQVMSGSYFLAFIGFLVLGDNFHKLDCNFAQLTPFPLSLNCLLGILACIFLFRYFHYRHRRKKLVNRYYEAYIVLKEKKTQQQEPAES